MQGLRGDLGAGGAFIFLPGVRGGEEMTLLRMAASYRQSGNMIRLRIVALREAAREAEPSERSRLEQRIRELNILYRDTCATARVLERYYDRRYHDK